MNDHVWSAVSATRDDYHGSPSTGPVIAYCVYCGAYGDQPGGVPTECPGRRVIYFQKDISMIKLSDVPTIAKLSDELLECRQRRDMALTAVHFDVTAMDAQGTQRTFKGFPDTMLRNAIVSAYNDRIAKIERSLTGHGIDVDGQ